MKSNLISLVLAVLALVVACCTTAWIVQNSMQSRDPSLSDVYERLESLERYAPSADVFYEQNRFCIVKEGYLELTAKEGVVQDGDLTEGIYRIVFIQSDGAVQIIDPRIPKLVRGLRTEHLEKEIMGKYIPRMYTPGDPEYWTKRTKYDRVLAGK